MTDKQTNRQTDRISTYRLESSKNVSQNMKNFIKGRGVSPVPQKNLTEKTRLFYGKWGGGLPQSKKSLREKVKENPYWGEGRRGSR